MKTTRTILAAAVLSAMFVAAAPSWAQRYHDNELRVRLGAFRPDGEAEYWEEKLEDFTGDVDDLENAVFGLEYLRGLSRHLDLQVSGSYFQGDTTQAYRGYLDNFGDRIRHQTTLEVASLTGGLRFRFTGPDAALVPYLGGGGGIYSWRLEEDGDFIDFGAGNEIFPALFESDGLAFGYYGLVGLEAPITPFVSVFGEARWSRAEDELEGDFEGFGDIDLSGREFTAGISWKI